MNSMRCLISAGVMALNLGYRAAFGKCRIDGTYAKQQATSVSIILAFSLVAFWHAVRYLQPE